MRRILAFAVLIAACAPAQAQKTPAAIQAEINSSTAAGRLGGTILTDITNSFLSLTNGGPVGTSTPFTDTASFTANSFVSISQDLVTQNQNQAVVYIQANTPSNLGDTISFQKDGLAVYYETSNPIDPTINLGSGGNVATDFRGIVSTITPYGNAWAGDYIPGIVYQPATGAVSSGGACLITLGTSLTGTPTAGLNGNSVVAHDIGGVTGCTGTFVANVINNTQLTLTGSTFGGAYTSGGAISGDGYITGIEIDVYNGGNAISNPNGAVTGTITSVVNNGSGNCRINVSGTPFSAANGWTNGIWANVGGIKGATGCNGAFLATINSTSQIDLQNSVFGGTYVSGGGITGGRPKIAFQAAASGNFNSTAAYAIFNIGTPQFYHGLIAQQNALITDFINLYATNGLAQSSLYNVNTVGVTTGSLYITTGAGGGFQLNRRDTNANVYTWYSLTGSVQLFDNVAGADALNMAQGGPFNAVNGFASGGTAGASVTTTVRNAAGTGTCTIIFKGGLDTGAGTC
jgi:hypothetical protein